MSKLWRFFFPGYLWSLPHTLVGVVIAAIAYRATSWRFSDGCIECIGGKRQDGTTQIWGKPGAQTHGCLIVYSNEKNRDKTRLRAHERTHVVQGFVGGPLFVLAYGACFLYAYAQNGFCDWYSAYMRNPFEKQAYATADDPDIDNKWGGMK